VHPKLHIEDKGDTITIRVSTGALPDLKLVRETLEEAHATFADDRTGVVADYIPALARVSPDLFGISVVGVGGREVGIGDFDHMFSIKIWKMNIKKWQEIKTGNKKLWNGLKNQ
jgi:glutaminase